MKKDLTRFAPAWGLYLVGLLLGLILLLGDNTEYWFVANLGTLTNGMSIINLCYAAVTAQLLFGDLFNSRMCNALHALPLRRETQFGTHILSGLLFSILPTAVFTIICLPLVSLSIVVDAWQIPLYFFAGANLQYLFFFSLAVLGVMCAGNRVGAAIIYGIVNFLSYIAYFLVDTVYTPMLHGVVTQTDIFELLCPVARMISTELVEVARRKESISIGPDGTQKYQTWGEFTVPGESWMYLAVLVGIGVLFLLLALRLYKKRQLECAGDLMATRALEPAFMVIYSLIAAALFQVVNQMFDNDRELMYLFLAAGLAVGWFTGRMLIERQVQVFRRAKNWLGFGALALALAASLGITWLDPFGIEDWVPKAEDVRSISVGIGYRGQVTLTERSEIEEVIYFHELLLAEKLTDEEIAATQHIVPEAAEITSSGIRTITIEEPQPVDRQEYRESSNVYIIYELKNGRRVEREYDTWLDTEQGQMLRDYMSTLEAVFSNYSYIKDADDLLAQADTPTYFNVDGHPLPEEYLTEEAVEELLRCVIADCEAGTMAQYSNFHDEPVLICSSELRGEYSMTYLSVDIVMEDGEGLYFSVYADSENSLHWLEATGVLEDIRESYELGYG